MCLYNKYVNLFLYLMFHYNILIFLYLLIINESIFNNILNIHNLENYVFGKIFEGSKKQFLTIYFINVPEYI